MGGRAGGTSIRKEEESDVVAACSLTRVEVRVWGSGGFAPSYPWKPEQLPRDIIPSLSLSLSLSCVDSKRMCCCCSSSFGLPTRGFAFAENSTRWRVRVDMYVYMYTFSLSLDCIRVSCRGEVDTAATGGWAVVRSSTRRAHCFNRRAIRFATLFRVSRRGNLTYWVWVC